MHVNDFFDRSNTYSTYNTYWIQYYRSNKDRSQIDRSITDHSLLIAMSPQRTLAHIDQIRVLDVEHFVTMVKLYDAHHHHHHSSRGAAMMRSHTRTRFNILILIAISSSTTGTVAAFESFPTSTRQALAQKAQELNPTSSSPSITTGGGGGGGGFAYTSSSWSNRAATVLTPICLDPCGLYTADRPFLWNSIDVGCRMTVIELPASSSNNKYSKPDLWVHSPVGIDGPLRDSMAKLGTVKYVVSPNYEHVKFAPAWHLTYPEADMWACPGLSQRMENVKWKGEIPNGLRPPGWKKNNSSRQLQGATSDDDKSSSVVPEAMWDTNILQALHVNIEANPFTGKPFFSTSCSSVEFCTLS
jgi:hypothetical protein